MVFVNTHFLWNFRYHFRRKSNLFSEREVEVFVDAVVAMAEPVKNWRANALVTHNVRDFGTVPARFGIEVMIPRDAINSEPPNQRLLQW